MLLLILCLFLAGCISSEPEVIGAITETFTMPPVSRVDVLYVIDTSPSMAPYRDAIHRSGKELAKVAAQSLPNYEYRIHMIAMGDDQISPVIAMHSFREGCLADPDPQECVRQKAVTAINAQLDEFKPQTVERRDGFSTVLTALSDDRFGECLLVIFLTDEDECSNCATILTPAEWLAQMYKYIDLRDGLVLVRPPMSPTCDPESNDRYTQVINGMGYAEFDCQDFTGFSIVADFCHCRCLQKPPLCQTPRGDCQESDWTDPAHFALSIDVHCVEADCILWPETPRRFAVEYDSGCESGAHLRVNPSVQRGAALTVRYYIGDKPIEIQTHHSLFKDGQATGERVLFNLLQEESGGTRKPIGHPQ